MAIFPQGFTNNDELILNNMIEEVTDQLIKELG